MKDSEQILFEQLKKEVETTYKTAFPYCQTPIEEWKGQDIVNFQEDLIKKVSGRISEKWFYTHIKASQDKIPRLDMLNMLCQYAGYDNWQHFTASKDLQTPVIKQDKIQTPLDDKKEEIVSDFIQPKIETKSNSNLWLIRLAIIFAITFLFGGIKWAFFSEKTFRVCFIDSSIKDAIKNVPIDVIILNKNESPTDIKVDSNGCFSITTKENEIRFVVKSPYYKTDTIVRLLDKRNTEESIGLNTDNYALMIHYFSTANVEDWKSRRIKLGDIFADNAKIFQVHPNGLVGMELYNKEEFIDKITIPVNSLKNIDIIDIKYNNGQILELKFRQTAF